MERGGSVYIMTNKFRTTLYIGVTSNLPARVYEHINHVYPKSFTSRYKLTDLVYHEMFLSIEEAINREKEIKGWRRSKKDELVSSFNPNWMDLYEEIKEW